MSTPYTEIGRVLRASTNGFTCGTRSQEVQYPTFGAFVTTNHETDGNLAVVGLITAIRIDDDPLVRQLIMAGNDLDGDGNLLRDQRENRLVPVEIDVLNIGYVQGDKAYYNLPPRPPLSLDPVYLCEPYFIHAFTEKLDFLRLVLNASQLSTVDLVGAAILKAATAYPQEVRRAFLVAAGRELAGLLSHDMAMLQAILKIIRPSNI